MFIFRSPSSPGVTPSGWAAKELGFRKAFIARPLEHGDSGLGDAEFSDEFDISAVHFADLADHLGC